MWLDQSVALDLTPATQSRSDWGVSSETGRVTDVLLAAPSYLSMVPCNAVTRDSLARGLACSRETASAQHDALAATLTAAGVRCHFAPPAPGFPDLAFTRDAVAMSPWGLIELRPAPAHRRDEPAHIAAVAAALGIPNVGRVTEGHIEGGDVCLLREGTLLIGCSGDRTDRIGAQALAALFEQRGWEVLYTGFDPEYLHLDTIFTMVSADLAVGYVEALDDGLLVQLARLGIGIVPASRGDVASLSANLLSLGDGRVLAPAGTGPLNRILERSGLEVIEVEIGQFTRCGGGVHCLTMPLARTEPAQG